MPFFFSRRAVMAGLTATASLRLGTPAQAAPIEGLDILGAPMLASVLMVRLLESGGLNSAAPGASFRLWRDTDELRAGIVSGRTKLFTTPTHVPANLANRGLPLKLLCLISMGHLSIVTSDPSIEKFADLAGKPVLGFFRNDMPDIVFRGCCKMEGLDPDRDIKLTYVQTPMEAAQMLAADRATTAILSEPPATAAIMTAHQQGHILTRAISLQDIWVKHRGTKGIPMAAVAVHADLVKEAPDLLAALRSGLPQAKDWVLANRAEAAALADKSMQIKPPIFLNALDHAGVAVVSAQADKKDLVDFYQTILDLSPATLGGRLPPDDFYLDL